LSGHGLWWLAATLAGAAALTFTETHKARKYAIPVRTPRQRFFPEGRPFVAARLCLNSSFAELLRRIRAEYLEMPGLRLTAPQAQRLFGLDSETWDAVSAALLDAKFLSHTDNRVFAMAATPA
jgi:hypothetical protein